MIREVIEISSEGKRDLISDDEIGGAGVEDKPNRAGSDLIRVEIGSWSLFCSSRVFAGREDNLI
jgi:hypothetical protein